MQGRTAVRPYREMAWWILICEKFTPTLTLPHQGGGGFARGYRTLTYLVPRPFEASVPVPLTR